MNVFLDLDGTLVNPREGITRCIAYALEQLGITPPPPVALEDCIGPPLQESLAGLVGHVCRDHGAKALRLYRSRYNTKGIHEQFVYPGVTELLAGIQARGWCAYLVTSKPASYAERIIDHFGLRPWFAGLHGSRLDGALTNKGELIAWVLQREATKPGETIMVGDRQHDIEGAHSNGLAAIGVTYGFGSREELRQAGVDYLCDAPDAILDTLATHFAPNR